MSLGATALVRVTQPARRALKSDFVRHSAIVFSANLLANGLNYAFNAALSRRLGIEGFATLSSLISVMMICSIPPSIMSLIVVKYTGAFHAAEDVLRIRRLATVLLRWTGAAAVLTMAAGYLLRYHIAAFLQIPNVDAVVFSAAIISLGFINPCFRGILQGQQDFRRLSLSLLSEALLKAALGVVFVYSGFGPAGAMLGWGLGTLCSTAYTAYVVLVRTRKPGERVAVRLSLDRKELTETAVGVGFATAFVTLVSFMDVLLVKHYFDAHSAGIYAAVNLVGKIVLLCSSFVPVVLLPKAVAKASRGENSIPLLLQAIGLALAMSAAVTVLFSLRPAMWISLIAGGQFAAAAPLMLQYNLAMCALAVLTVLVNYRIATHSFGFLYIAAVLLAAEIGAIGLFHHSLLEIVHILIVANLAGVAGCVLTPAGVLGGSTRGDSCK